MAANTTPASPEATGQQQALEVEHKLLNNDIKGAEETFRQHYLDSMKSQKPEDRKVADAERARLQHIDPSGYKLVVLELAKDTQVLTETSSARGDIRAETLMARLPDATPEDKLKGAVASEVLKDYDALIGGVTHDVKHFFSPGANSVDADRMEEGLKDGLHNRQMAMTSMQTFLADDGKVFDKIAGINGRIDQGALHTALEKDAQLKAKHQPGLFTPEQQKQVKWMDDNWQSPAVRQLREGDWEMTPTNRLNATWRGLVDGWNHALGANFHGIESPLNWGAGVIDAAGEAAFGLVSGDKLTSFLNKDAMQKAVTTNFGSEANARAIAGGPMPSEQIAQKPQTDQKHPAGYQTPEAKTVADKAAADKAVADKAVADKALADKALADKALADKAVADKALADKALADKALADKALADKALADKALADKALADKALADKALADKDKAAAEKATEQLNEKIRDARTVQPGHSYAQTAEQLLALAGIKDPSAMQLHRLSHQLWEADRHRPAYALPTGTVLKLSPAIRSNPDVAKLLAGQPDEYKKQDDD